MLRVSRLVWEDWNIVHISRHQVIPSEVEEVCHGKPMVSKTYKGRLRVIGPTLSGRMLTVILDPELAEGVYYPVTVRTADRKERKNWQLQTKGVK